MTMLRVLRSRALALACRVLAAGRGAAEDYPSRPVKIIAPFGAGGPTDVFTRAIARGTAARRCISLS